MLPIDFSISLGVNLRTQMVVRSFARADRPLISAPAHSRRHISRDFDKDLLPQRAVQYNANLIKWNLVLVVVVVAVVVVVLRVIVSIVPGNGKLVDFDRKAESDTIRKNRENNGRNTWSRCVSPSLISGVVVKEEVSPEFISETRADARCLDAGKRATLLFPGAQSALNATAATAASNSRSSLPKPREFLSTCNARHFRRHSTMSSKLVRIVKRSRTDSPILRT